MHRIHYIYIYIVYVCVTGCMMYEVYITRLLCLLSSAELKAPPNAVNLLGTNTKMEVSAHLLWKPGKEGTGLFTSLMTL